jgi:hypothetical protein
MPRRSWPHGATASRTSWRLPPERPVTDQRGRLLMWRRSASPGSPARPTTARSGHSASGSTPRSGGGVVLLKPFAFRKLVLLFSSIVLTGLPPEWMMTEL